MSRILSNSWIAYLIICLSLGSLISPGWQGLIPTTGLYDASSPASLWPDSDTLTSRIPSLDEFSYTVETGSGEEPAGVYVRGALALRVVQQPSSNPASVTIESDSVSQFSLAANHGTLGLLAHNYLAGGRFFDLKIGQTVVVIRGNGSRSYFRIDAIRHFQALSPLSSSSDFLDLDRDEARLSALELFNQMYTVPGQLVFQTCIEENGNQNWGRLFIVASLLGSRDHHQRPLAMLTRELMLDNTSIDF